MQFNTTGLGSLNSYDMVALHLHMIFVGIAFFGLITALIWLFKHANKNQIKQVCIWSLVIGILGVLITAPFAFSGWQAHRQIGTNKIDQKEFLLQMQDMLDDELSTDEITQ
ncbi:hypothetical protein COV81_01735 [Candidatus Peregrinibacteria bacterium CG11_big_fil_rev_8_21_14_0_20_41_10]|nr:MAG: hypothetical protein COV81_01735 [Candidatus Peregrinibacteria bacterium CG11_big_fil_rev_8_21_14_0_20_41_10]PJC37590.1 MAG: hypothetical protein CO045_04735 [Candidatus Peregrinibacteria bacterium CG_4_9_14_0_2_um_filter_41_14]